MTKSVFLRRAPILDERLSAAMELAGDTLVFADIGADHGRLSAVMLLQDERRQALVSDISPAALSKARERISRMGLSERAVFAVSDGLEALKSFPHVPDTIFILGMGGETVSSILARGALHLGKAALVLGAQTEWPLVRQTLLDIGYCIANERIANESGRDYLLMLATPVSTGRSSYSEEELLLGPILLQTHPAGWVPVLLRRKRLLEQAIHAMEATMLSKDTERLALFRREYTYVLRALEHYRKE